MINQLRIVAICSIPLMLHGCGGNADAAEQRSLTSPAVIHAGVTPYSGGFTSKGYRIFTSQTAYQNELANYSADTPQVIDFEENRVMLVDMGQRNTGGYGVAVESVVDASDHVVVTIVSRVPGQGCMVTQALTNPYEFIKIATNKEVLIQEKLNSVSCE